MIKSGMTVAAHCAKVKDIIKTVNPHYVSIFINSHMLINFSIKDPRFPLGVPGNDVNYRVLCHPICSEQEDIEVVY